MYKTTINRNRKGSEAPEIDPRLRRAIMKHAGIDALRAFDLAMTMDRYVFGHLPHRGTSLSFCFIWRETPEGCDFWRHLNRKLHKLEGFPL